MVGYHSMHIISHFKRYYAGRRIIYVFQENLNGTGGALHLAKSVLKDKFLVMMGDDLYCKKDLDGLLKHNLAILGYEVNDARNFGVIKVGKDDTMKDVLEKPKNIKKGLVNTGAYLLNRDFFNYGLVSVGNGEFGLPQTMAKMSDKYKIKVEKASFWHPIGKPEDLKSAEKNLYKFI